MLITSDFLAAVMTTYRAIFTKALGDLAPGFDNYQKIATVFNSTTDKETYDWLGHTPSLQEWKDKREFKGLRNFDYTLTNKHYEGTIEVNRDTYEDDKLGQIPVRVRGLARNALKYFNEKVFSQLDDGATLLAYDGAAMFADTRVIGASANIDNLLSGSYSGSSAEIRAAISAAVVAMMAYQDDWGKPMGLMPDTVVCSPSMGIPIKEALKADVAGHQRTEADFIKDVIISPWIDATVLDWFVLCTTEEVKPVIFQLRKAPAFEALDDPKSDHVFKNNTFLYGTDCRFEVGFGDPRTAIKIVDA